MVLPGRLRSSLGVVLLVSTGGLGGPLRRHSGASSSFEEVEEEAEAVVLRRHSASDATDPWIRSIEDWGAKPSKKSHAKRNGAALALALISTPENGTVLVPGGRLYYVVPQQELSNLASNVTLRIDGALVASDAIAEWPLDVEANDYAPLIKVSKTANLTITGAGRIDGRGHKWWWAFVAGFLEYKRPVLLDISDCVDVTVHGLVLLDSPRFHLYLGENTRRATVSNVTILVDWRSQLHYLKQRSSVPMFPFNTDGVDVAGTDVLLEHLVVSNFDDVVAVKPGKRDELVFTTRNIEWNTPNDNASTTPPPFDEWDWCTRRVAIRHVTTLYGAGMSVGSVHPAYDLPCVVDVSFEHLELWSPLKGPYVKPDIGLCDDDQVLEEERGGRLQATACAALIANVSYFDVTLTQDAKPDWWDAFEARQRARGTDVVADDDPAAAAQDDDDEEDEDDPFPDPPVVPPLEKRSRILDDDDDDGAFSCGTYDFLCFSWPVFIGTQQQLEPDGEGSGIWATTDPRCTVANVTLEAVTATGGTWPEGAGAIRCNASNPCTGIRLKDVVIEADRFLKGAAWVCDAANTAFGALEGSVVPDASACVFAADDAPPVVAPPPPPPQGGVPL
eukprot:CAMPEP_0185702702 /NCGR_PEP_ID=MMETSP1164-20130828/12673_1 /TAXON_ID=1104430 /ORGANISM="Chrysoreinhardia sp, Strain CCMP2950" /LENGTH=616 /DNA_ID=CAMNT_0028369939 /DNA_START=48 /DNA_END=1898 /DNA_ORIENTATION=+